ncbi:5-pentadecatrienyl resorcinol O-methyltransferase-like [Miscanthus floridulus]|uniref:5-pentadecatrienyl resorcinol O-methyltransferase-like n=1 Tax=Miscanthus floridulus TaxID=154761 RepID=UPI00345B0C4B
MMALTETEPRRRVTRLQAHDELWHQSLSYLKSLALAVALDLRIPDAIHHHGNGATLPQILAETALHPCKLRALRRLMRVLTVSGTFSVVHVQQPPPAGSGSGDDDSTVADAASDDEAAVVYRLTAASRFLVSDEVSSATLAPFVSLALYPIASSQQPVGLCAWFRQEQNDPSPCGLTFQLNM